MPKILRDICGERFGRLTALEDIEVAKDGHTITKCICDCGNFSYPRKTNLINGRVMSCGCERKENVIKTHLKHGKYGSRIYRIWNGINNRCKNNSKKNKHYANRGISLCVEWKDFINFYNWAISNGYADNLTIDRIDVNGNYEPSNCRWITLKEQNRNRRNNKMITYLGETKCLTEWAEYTGINPAVIRRRIYKLGWSINEALTIPVRGFKKGG